MDLGVWGSEGVCDGGGEDGGCGCGSGDDGCGRDDDVQFVKERT